MNITNKLCELKKEGMNNTINEPANKLQTFIDNLNLVPFFKNKMKINTQ